MENKDNSGDPANNIVSANQQQVELVLVHRSDGRKGAVAEDDGNRSYN